MNYALLSLSSNQIRLYLRSKENHEKYGDIRFTPYETDRYILKNLIISKTEFKIFMHDGIVLHDNYIQKYIEFKDCVFI